MSFDAILGQPTAVETLRRALASDRLHHAYRFEGPAGVGKERAAFALAQALVCTERAQVGCGRCNACERAVTFSEDEPRVPRHPDVVVVERGLYPASVLGRTSPETAGIGVEQVRRIIGGRAAYPPHEAGRLVFIIRAAHELTPNAANALLKTLEEPRPEIVFVLLTDQPRRLLDTIRSRTLPIRFGPLPDTAVAEILRRNGRPQPSPEILALAGGSASRALELGDPEQTARRERFVSAVLSALAAPDLAPALALGNDESRERTDLTDQLLGLGQYFAQGARRFAASDLRQSRVLAECHQEVQVALDALSRHAAPALALEALLARLRRTGVRAFSAS